MNGLVGDDVVCVVGWGVWWCCELCGVDLG